MVITDVEGQIRDLVERVAPAVVGVGARGSGVVVGDGLLVTNAHHVHEDEVPVAFADGRTSTGGVLGTDVDGDVAVLGVDTEGIRPPEWSPEPAAVGAFALALARSRTGELRATTGVVSATAQSFRGPGGRRVTGAIEHTAPLARGSSGGPVVDALGRLAGVNTNRLTDGFYLALTADDELRARVDGLAAGRQPQRRRLGVGVAPAPVARRLRTSVGLPPRDGVLVRAVMEGGPAARGGLRVGDLIVAAGDTPVSDVDDLHRVLDGPDARATEGALDLQVVRGTDEFELTVPLGTPGE